MQSCRSELLRGALTIGSSTASGEECESESNNAEERRMAAEEGSGSIDIKFVATGREEVASACEICR
mgnify:CR=1 FL=1